MYSTSNFLSSIYANYPTKLGQMTWCLAVWIKFSAIDILKYFSYFFGKHDLTFHANCLLSPVETICMKCQVMFSGKVRKISPICHLLNYPREWLRLSCSRQHTPFCQPEKGVMDFFFWFFFPWIFILCISLTLTELRLFYPEPRTYILTVKFEFLFFFFFF